MKTELDFKNLVPMEDLKYKMEVNELRNKDVVEIIGSKSKVSEVLNRK